MKLQVGDVHVNYADVGRGEPVGFLTGLGADHTAAQFQIQAFAERFRVIAPDNRDTGATTHNATSYSAHTLAQDVVGLVSGLAIERAHVVGVSLGGLIAQEIALSHPELVATLGLHSTFARGDAYLAAHAALVLSMRRHLPLEDFVRAMMLWMFSRHTFASRPKFIERMTLDVLGKPHSISVEGLTRQIAVVLSHDTLDRLAGIRCPTLVTAGEDDSLLLRHFSRAMVDKIPDGRLVVFDGLGHGTFLEAPEVFNEASLTFIKKYPLA